jgi:hypothetical protein
MLTINNKTADLFLGHPDINSGDPYPFMLWKRIKPVDYELREEEGQNLSIQIEVNQDADPITMDKAFYFTVLLKDHSFSDGDTFTEADQREKLYSILGAGDRIFLHTSEGTYSALESDGHVITETQFENYSLAQVRLSASNAVFLPIPNTRFSASLWLAPDWSDFFLLDSNNYEEDLATIIFYPSTTPRRYFLKLALDGLDSSAVYFYSTSSNDEWVLEFEFISAYLSGLAASEIYCIARLTDGLGSYVDIILQNNAGTFQIQCSVDTLSTTVSTSFYNVSSTDLFTVKVSVLAESGSGTADGEVKLYLDDVLKETLSSLDTYSLWYIESHIGWIEQLSAISDPSNMRLFFGDVSFADNLSENWNEQWTFPVGSSSQWGDGGTTQVNQAYWR